MTLNLYFLKGVSSITKGNFMSGTREKLESMLPIRRFTKKPSGSQQSGKCAGKGRISFLQQIFPESLFISGQCKQKMNTKLQN